MTAEQFVQTEGYIRTLSGIELSLFNPTPDMIEITDIASGLAYKSHFAGQTPFFFSLAQHSLLVEELLSTETPASPKLRMISLLHDASEAYIGDMVKPLKVHLPLFQQVEDKITEAIMSKFGLFNEYKTNYKRLVKPFDIDAQIIEYNTFYEGEFLHKHRKYERWVKRAFSPDMSKGRFLSKFHELEKMIWDENQKQESM